MQVRVDVAFSSLNSAGQQARNQATVYIALLRRISSSLGNLSLYSLRPSTDWMRPSRIMEYNLVYSKSADLNVNHILRISPHQHLDGCLTQRLGIIA